MQISHRSHRSMQPPTRADRSPAQAKAPHSSRVTRMRRMSTENVSTAADARTRLARTALRQARCAPCVGRSITLLLCARVVHKKARTASRTVVRLEASRPVRCKHHPSAVSLPLNSVEIDCDIKNSLPSSLNNLVFDVSLCLVCAPPPPPPPFSSFFFFLLGTPSSLDLQSQQLASGISSSSARSKPLQQFDRQVQWLQQNEPFLVSARFLVGSILDELISAGVYSSRDQDYRAIIQPETHHERIRNLLRSLESKGQKAISAFQRALRHRVPTSLICALALTRRRVMSPAGECSGRS